MKVDGIELLNDSQDMVVHSIAKGPWEAYSRVLWKTIVQTLPENSVIWDVGAYTGYYAMLAAITRPDLSVVAFEPHPDIYAALCANVQHNKLHNVSPVNAALGQQNCASFINVTNTIQLPSGSSIVNIGKPIAKVLPITIVRGDSVPESASQAPSLIKIDVEEYEVDVLRGMADILHSKKPTILIEILREHKLGEVAAVLEPLGYKISRINENGANLVAPFSPSDRNYICTID